MPTQYSFVTYWKIDAPVEKVWDAIYNSTDWNKWWKGVVSVTETSTGDKRGIDSIREYTWKSALPYQLIFSMRLTENIEYKKLTGIAFGELEGEGTWIFEERNGSTYVTYYWNVFTNKFWMNYLSFILKPLFKYNHNIVMRWGEECLKKRLKNH